MVKPLTLFLCNFRSSMVCSMKLYHNLRALSWVLIRRKSRVFIETNFWDLTEWVLLLGIFVSTSWCSVLGCVAE
jgi:hypothetical protein